MTLLALYTLPESLPRLVDIATNLKTYAKAGARVIAVPVGGEPAADALSSVPGGESVLATAGADVAAAYALFGTPRPGTPGDGVPAHAEYLIDRQGQLRVRWIGIPDERQRSERGIAGADRRALPRAAAAVAAVGTSALTFERRVAPHLRRASSGSIAEQASTPQASRRNNRCPEGPLARPREARVGIRDAIEELRRTILSR